MRRINVEELEACREDKIIDLEEYRELKERVDDDYKKFGDLIYKDEWGEDGIYPF